MNIKTRIIEDLDLPISFVDEVLTISRKHVKTFKIPKRNGSSRLIHQPSKKIKTIQYWLSNNIFQQIVPDPAALGFRRNLSILDNAKKHQENKYFLKVDLENFFPSIEYKDLKPYLQAWFKQYGHQISWKLDTYALELIRKVCFFHNDTLPIGYPSSPEISNIVMKDFDSEVGRILKKAQYSDVIYTRYADDLTFSTSKPGVTTKIQCDVYDLIKRTNSPNIKVQKHKTVSSSSTGGSAFVTGLKICEDQHITIHRAYKDHIRLLMSLYSKGKLKEEEYQSLRGHLSYIQNVAPLFFSNLSKKYFSEIDKLFSN